MGRARRARNIAARAAYGGGVTAAGAVGVGLTTWGVLRGEAVVARRLVGHRLGDAPDDEGRYGAGPGEPIDIAIVGDSSAAGLGADDRSQTVGAIIATAAAALEGRPVQLTNVAVVGAISTDLGVQVETLLESVPHPAVVVIMIGANDVTSRMPRTTSVRHLAAAVFTLREAGAEVVVGTCPDLGVIEPVPQPLRLLARRWSRDLAAAQTVAVVEAGGRTVSLGDLLGHEFEQTPQVMFSKDRFHPSSAGYARAASALLPSVLDALGLRTIDTDRAPDVRRGESVAPVSVAAKKAVRDPGTEVKAADVAGNLHGRNGRWAVHLRRHREAASVAEPDADETTGSDASDTSYTPE